MNWLKSKKIVLTHSGSFHPDDVFAVALFSILYKGRIKVIRTREESEYPKADIIVDTGLIYDPETDKFDHHQEGNAGFRGNNISYSSFGLAWNKYGEQICGSKEVANIIDKKLVEVIDAHDCGTMLHKNIFQNISPFLISDAILAWVPTWKEGNDHIDDYFMKAMAIAKIILEREIKIAQDMQEAKGLVDEAYRNSKDKRIVVFPEGPTLPKTLLCNYPEPLFAVYKDRMQKMWRVITIVKEERAFEVRKNFPQAWWGKRDADLAKVTGIADAVFCRNQGIFAGVTSKEGAIRLAELALKQ